MKLYYLLFLLSCTVHAIKASDLKLDFSTLALMDGWCISALDFSTFAFMDGWCISAMDNTHEVGYITFKKDDNVGEIKNLSVKKFYRNRGIGSLLLNKGVEHLHTLNCQTIKIKPFPFEANTNDFKKAKQRLIKLYLAHGFKEKDNDEFMWLNNAQ